MPAAATSGTGEILERADELHRLDAALRAAQAGRGSLVHLIGEGGIGKTALIQGAVARAVERDFTVLETSAGQLERGVPFGVCRRLFDRHLMGLSSDDREDLCAGPARLAVQVVLGLEHAAADQGDVINSLYWLLEGIAARGPVLVAADDAQWADEESLLFLAFLRERLGSHRVAVVIGTRETAVDDRGPALAVLVADRQGTVLHLTPLGVGSVTEVLARRWSRAVDPDVGAAAAAVTGGNPFLVQALAELLVDRAEQGAPITADMVHELVPSTVVDAVVTRMIDLPETARAVIRAVVVLDACSSHEVAQLAGLEPAEVSAAVVALRGVGLLAREGPLTFRHALLGAAARMLIDASVLEDLHRRAARIVTGGVHEAAAHLLAVPGGGDPWAVETLRSAARHSLDTGAPLTAVTLFRRAMAEPPSDAELPATLVELGMAELRTADASCVETLARAEGLLDSGVDRARVALALAEAYNYVGFHALAADLLQPALEDLGDDDADLALEVEAGLIKASLLVPERTADARARLATRPDMQGRTRGERLFCIQLMTNAAATNQPASRIREFALRALSPDDTPENTDWVWARLFLTAIGDFNDVRRLTDEGFAVAEERNSVLGFVTASFVRGLAEMWAGRLVEAEGHFQGMLDHASSLGASELIHILGSAGRAQCLGMQGRLEEAGAVLADLPEELPPEAPANGVAAMNFAQAVHAIGIGDFDRAERIAQRAEQLANSISADSPTWAAWRTIAIESLRGRGELDAARAVADDHLALCERSEVPILIGEALRLRGLVADDADERLAFLERSVEVLAPAGSRWQEALSRVALGAALRRAGRRTAAREELVTGHRLALECGARGLMDEAETELSALGTRVKGAESARVATLTASERRVVDLAVQGLSNPEIARRLFVSPKTVETHLSRSYRKLGVTGRRELASVEITSQR